LFLFVFVKSSQAQPFSKKPLSPAKMCHKLGEKRTKKFKKKFRLKKQKNDISRISYKPYDSHYKRSTLQAKVISKEDILNVPELIATNTENIPVSETLPTPLNNRHSEIRKLVEENIKNGKTNEPIVESLYFITDEAEFAYANFDPFLLAVEYALQGKMVLVEGYTDDRGDEEHNLQLSMKRVRQIETLMHDIGVSGEKISVIGYGESMPKYDNSTEEGRQKNRRIDFKIF
ncbi:MAG: OmpA family protein, partial [Cyclobacteriaceae bacterium]|nr:OmpA family protein [Cyclobacteriaceae bacterium]